MKITRKIFKYLIAASVLLYGPWSLYKIHSLEKKMDEYNITHERYLAEMKLEEKKKKEEKNYKGLVEYTTEILMQDHLNATMKEYVGVNVKLILDEEKCKEGIKECIKKQATFQVEITSKKQLSEIEKRDIEKFIYEIEEKEKIEIVFN